MNLAGYLTNLVLFEQIHEQWWTRFSIGLLEDYPHLSHEEKTQVKRRAVKVDRCKIFNSLFELIRSLALYLEQILSRDICWTWLSTEPNPLHEGEVS